MQDEGSAKGLEAAFQKNWEKLAIGIVLLGSLVYLGSRFAGAGPTEEAAVTKMEDTVKKAEQTRNEKITAPRPFKQVSDPQAVAPFKPQPFTHCYKTKFTVEGAVVAGPTIDFVIPDVVLNSATPSFDGVSLAWSLTETKPDPTVRGQHVVEPKTFYFQIERTTKGGSWKIIVPKLRVKDNKDLKYRDSNTEPKTDYEYRVTLGSDEKKWLDKNKSGLLPRSSAVLAARTPRMYQLTFDNIQKPPEDEGPTKGTAWVTIVKFDPVAGEVSIRFSQTEGDRIGWTTPEGGKPTSIHRVFSKKLGKSVPVDFNTGATIRKILVDQTVGYTYKECQKVATGEGMECKGPQPKTDSYKANKVIYEDDEKKEEIVLRPIGLGPRPDQLCEDHGGAPPPPREEKPAADREDAAKKLLAEAEALWSTEKPSERKKAQKIYKELLDKYSDTEAMKVRKYQAESRVKEAIK